jgi:hypothetical protein
MGRAEQEKTPDRKGRGSWDTSEGQTLPGRKGENGKFRTPNLQGKRGLG